MQRTNQETLGKGRLPVNGTVFIHSGDKIDRNKKRMGLGENILGKVLEPSVNEMGREQQVDHIG